MKIAKPNNVAVQTERTGILNNYYRVPDAYDFAGNNAEDVTNVPFNGGTILDLFNQADDDEQNRIRKSGFATLVAGEVTVPNQRVRNGANGTRILVSVQRLGTVARPAAIGISSRIAGTSFTIMSSDPTDTSTVYWEFRPKEV